MLRAESVFGPLTEPSGPYADSRRPQRAAENACQAAMQITVRRKVAAAIGDVDPGQGGR